MGRNPSNSSRLVEFAAGRRARAAEAEKRRLVLPFDAILRTEALATLDAAKVCAAGPRPLPLVNDPKCPRCSRQPICLPDEVNQQRREGDGNVCHFNRVSCFGTYLENAEVGERR